MAGDAPGPEDGPDFADAPSRAAIEQALRRLADQPSEAIDLAGTALLLAALERPRVSLERYRLHLHEIEAALARRAAGRPDSPSALEHRAIMLIEVLRTEMNYRGDDLTYDDLQNANLMRVIDRRKGLPVALGILYLHAARAQRWTAYGLNFPGHFLIALESDGTRLVIDPFTGRRLEGANELRALLKAVAGQSAELTPQHCAPLSNRAVLLRLENNIKARLIAQGRHEKAAAVLDRMLLFAPRDVDLWHEAGVEHARAGNLKAATGALEQVLAMARQPEVRRAAAELLQSLRRRLN